MISRGVTRSEMISVLTSLKLDDEGFELGFVLVIGHLLPDSMASVDCKIKLGLKVLAPVAPSWTDLWFTNPTAAPERCVPARSASGGTAGLPASL